MRSDEIVAYKLHYQLPVVDLGKVFVVWWVGLRVPNLVAAPVLNSRGAPSIFQRGGGSKKILNPHSGEDSKNVKWGVKFWIRLNAN